MKIKFVLIGFILGFLFVYPLTFLSVLLMSFTSWKNYLILFSIKDLFLVRIGIVTGIIGGIIGWFLSE